MTFQIVNRLTPLLYYLISVWVLYAIWIQVSCHSPEMHASQQASALFFSRSLWIFTLCWCHTVCLYTGSVSINILILVLLLNVYSAKPKLKHNKETSDFFNLLLFFSFPTSGVSPSVLSLPSFLLLHLFFPLNVSLMVCWPSWNISVFAADGSVRYLNLCHYPPGDSASLLLSPFLNVMYLFSSLHVCLPVLCLCLCNLSSFQDSRSRRGEVLPIWQHLKLDPYCPLQLYHKKRQTT